MSRNVTTTHKDAAGELLIRVGATLANLPAHERAASRMALYSTLALAAIEREAKWAAHSLRARPPVDFNPGVAQSLDRLLHLAVTELRERLLSPTCAERAGKDGEARATDLVAQCDAVLQALDAKPQPTAEAKA